MIDWHSHILPKMDDGSRDTDESLEMLGALEKQGVDVVIATPHFYANEESAEEFLRRRKASYELLRDNMQGSKIRVVCGAEVKYYPGISRMEDINKLTIENTNLLLLEMPFARWTDHTVRELYELSNMRGLKIVIAHIERYISMQDKGLIGELVESGMLVQMNASFFANLGSRRKAAKLLSSGFVHFLGTDCHNMTTRKPNIDLAYNFIRRKFGEEFTLQMNEFGYHALA